MFGRITGISSTSLPRTLHVSGRPVSNMTPAELAAAIRDDSVDAQRIAIQHIMNGNARTIEDIVLSALEECVPGLDAHTQDAILANQSEEMLQSLRHNPRLMSILERFFVSSAHQDLRAQAEEEASIAFVISLDNLQHTLNHPHTSGTILSNRYGFTSSDFRSSTHTPRTATSEFEEVDIHAPPLVAPRYAVSTSGPYAAIVQGCNRQLHQQSFSSKDFYASILRVHEVSEMALFAEEITPDEYQQICREINILLDYAKIKHGFSSQ